MNRLQIVHLSVRYYNDKMNRLSLLMDKIERHRLNYAPWCSYPYKPSAQFSIAYTGDEILLKFFVIEKTIRAAVAKINGPVWEDSCVKLFISFEQNGYYNLEFNCIGIVLGEFGAGRLRREKLAENKLKKIKFQSQIQKIEEDLLHWELTVSIPVKIFSHQKPSLQPGKQCRLNLYKCGDALPEPHFIAWSEIQSDEPDFHLPQFFGEASFD